MPVRTLNIRRKNSSTGMGITHRVNNSFLYGDLLLQIGIDMVKGLLVQSQKQDQKSQHRYSHDEQDDGA